MLDFDHCSVGAELELADIDTRIPLPSDNKYCLRDGSIANTNGTANDPLKKLNIFGSEINVKPCNSPEELLEETLKIYEIHKTKLAVNWSTNLHCHIRVPGLRDNLDALKKIQTYLHTYEKEMYELIDPVPVPTEQDYPTEEAMAGAMKRYKRRFRSHQFALSKKTYEAVMSANTPKEFFENHCVKDKNGKPQWHLLVRAGVNLTSLRDTDTIEFRHFTMSLDPNKMWSAYMWPKIFLQNIFEEQLTPKELLAKHPALQFQQFHHYNYEQDVIFQKTNVYHNSRNVAAKNYLDLVASGKIKQEELTG